MKTLVNKGPLFPKEYVYRGFVYKNDKFSPLAEEMLWKLAHFLDSDYWKKPVFQKNVWYCLKKELPPHLQNKDLSYFVSFLEHLKDIQEKEKEAKKNRSKEAKQKEKEEKAALKEEYGHVIIDGEKVPIGAFLIEDANWILTRGEDPRLGMWKYRVIPESVTINVVNSEPPKGWKGKVESRPDVVWVFKYDQLCGHGKKATLISKSTAVAKNSNIGKSMTAAKYDKAANVNLQWSKIESFIKRALDSDNRDLQELAVMSYLIAQTGIRIGNERDLSRQADTRGMSTLCVENISL